eukprot:PhM_4_TR15669/c5_g5_i2/m.3247
MTKHSHQYRVTVSSRHPEYICATNALDPATWMSYSDLQVVQAKGVLRQVYERHDAYEDEVRSVLDALGHAITLSVRFPQVGRSHQWVEAQRGLICRLEYIRLCRQGVSLEFLRAWKLAQEMEDVPPYLKLSHDRALRS